MAADDAAPFAQVQRILRAVLASPAITNGKTFTRTLIVSTEIADLKVSEKRVVVHPEWAVEKGPLEAAHLIIQACDLFDQRRAEARRARDAELRARLLDVVEDIRRAGAEYLIDEVHGAPTVRWRALVRRVRHEL